MGIWSPAASEELYHLVKQGEPSAVEAFFERYEFDEVPRPLSDNPSRDSFSSRLLWTACIEGHDAATFKTLERYGFMIGENLKEEDRNAYGWWLSQDKCWSSVCPDSAAITSAANDADKWYDFLEAILSRGFSIDEGAIGSGVENLSRFICTVLPENVSLLEHFRDCGITIVPDKSDRTTWESMLRQGRLRSIEFFKKSDYVFPDQEKTAYRLVIRPGTAINTIEQVVESGLDLRLIDVTCDRETLLFAARLGLRPSLEKHYGLFDSRWVPASLQNLSEQGMEYLCGTGDLEVIEAFLVAGVTEGADVALNRAEGRNDVADLLVKYGLPEVVPVLKNGKSCVDRASGTVVIPEGVERIEDDAFLEVERIGLKSISLPSSLKEIGDRGLVIPGASLRRTEVVIPKSVAKLGYGALYGVKRITVYDTINPDAVLRVDEANGTTNATVGWLGLRPNPHYALCASSPNASLEDFEVTVRSAETGDIKYRVWMPCSSAPRDLRCTYISSWGPNALFAFENVDSEFNELPNRESKVRTAINRLRWPVNLDGALRETMLGYLKKNTAAAIKLLCEFDDSESVEYLLGITDLKKSAVDQLIHFAREYNRAPNSAEVLLNYRNSTFGSAPIAKKREKQETVSQAAHNARLLLQKGDASGLDKLDGRSLKSVHPRDVVALFDWAAKLKDPAPTEHLYQLFGQPECDREAFSDAINCGNFDTALTLLAHGASLSSEIRWNTFTGDSPAKYMGRINEYESRDVYSTAIVITGEKEKRDEHMASVMDTIERLANVHAFSASDLKILCLTAAYNGEFDMAMKLVELGADDTSDGFITIYIGDYRKHTESRAYRFEDLLYPGCKPQTARFVCAVRPQVVSAKWSSAFLKDSAKTIKTLLPYLREDSFKGNKQELLLLLAKNGCTDELRIVSAWDGILTEQGLNKAIEIASTSGHVETSAFLLNERSRLFEADSEAPSLELDDDAIDDVTVSHYMKTVGCFDVMVVEEILVKGKVFVHTGLDIADEALVNEVISSKGGILKSSVVLYTDYLIVNENFGHKTTKYKRAIELNETRNKDIKIVALSDFYRLAR